MHELGIACEIVDIACDAALKRGRSGITRITVEIGRDSGVIGDLLEREMPYACQKTIAQGASIRIKKVPGDTIAVRSIRAA